MESAVARGRQGLTAPIEVSSGNRKIYRLSRRGNRRLNHVIHMAAVSQIRRRHSDGRADQKAMCVAMGGLQATPHPLGTGLLVPQHRRLRVPGRSRGHLGPGEAERLKWLWEWRRVLHGEQGIGTLARRSCDAAGVGPILESKARTPQGALEDPAFRRSARSRWHSPRRPRRTGSHWSRRTGRPVIPKIANRRPGLSRPLEAIPRWQRCWLPATATGRRDLAMLMLLARMGLRAPGGVGVADLTLDDIDWRSGEITIAGRGNRRDRLPLPADAGEAIAAHPAARLAGWRAGSQGIHPDPGAVARPDRGESLRRWPRPPGRPGWAPSTRTGCGTPRPHAWPCHTSAAAGIRRVSHPLGAPYAARPFRTSLIHL